jgi:hypothetical protein
VERWQRRVLRLRSSKPWLRVKSLFLPNAVILSHYRSGFQWFRQICHANLYRHVTMPPQARYQHYNVERMPPNPKLDRNAILLVRDGRDVMVSLYLSSTRDGPRGTRIWEGSGEQVTFQQFLRQEFMRVRTWQGEVVCLRTPADYWSRFNADWLESPHVASIVRYEDLLAEQSEEIRRVWRDLGYDEGEREPIEIALDFDKHSPVGENILPGFRRRSSGSWQKVFTAEDLELFETQAGDTMRRLGYDAGAPLPAVNAPSA